MAMEGGAWTIYVFARQWFAVPGEGRVAGPPGLSTYVGPPCGEDGCYAVARISENVAEWIVYETDQSYECFCPMGKWRERGVLRYQSAFQRLLEKEHLCGRDVSIPYPSFLSGGHYRVMYAWQASDTAFYAWVRSDRMPESFYAVYRLYGIEYLIDWWRSRSFLYMGTMPRDEAMASCCDAATIVTEAAAGN